MGTSKAAKQAALNELIAWIDAIGPFDIQDTHELTYIEAREAYELLVSLVERFENELKGNNKT